MNDMGTMNDRVKEFLYLDTKKHVLINRENGRNVYFYRFDFMKIHFLTSNLANYIDILNYSVVDYIISEAELSDNDYEQEEI